MPAHAPAYTMLRKSIMPKTFRHQSRPLQHQYRYDFAEQPPDVSRLPISIHCEIFLGISKIEISETAVRVSRHLFANWNEPLSSFGHIGCEKNTTYDPSIGDPIYVISLVHPKHGKTVTLYEFVVPQFDISQFIEDVSDLLGLPVRMSHKEWRSFFRW